MTRVLTLLLLGGAGCTTTTTPPPANVEKTATTQPPLAVRWEELAHGETSAELKALVQRDRAINATVTVTLLVPDGVTVDGPTTVKLPPNTGPVVDALPYKLRFASPPPGDLLLVAEVQTESFGVRASDAWRFGRPEPTRADPERSGGPLKLGDTNLGEPIPVQPAK